MKKEKNISFNANNHSGRHPLTFIRPGWTESMFFSPYFHAPISAPSRQRSAQKTIINTALSKQFEIETLQILSDSPRPLNAKSKRFTCELAKNWNVDHVLGRAALTKSSRRRRGQAKPFAKRARPVEVGSTGRALSESVLGAGGSGEDDRKDIVRSGLFDGNHPFKSH
jgi:hypothetical protein